MGRRVLAFFLGLILGMILIVGGAVGVIYFAVCVMPAEKIVPQSSNYLGDLAKLSVYDIGQSIYKLYGEKVGVVDENGKYYTVGEFCNKYHIDLNQVLGKEIPQDLLDMPIFEFFNFATDENNNKVGMNHVLSQIKVSTLPAVINMFKGENGGYSDEVLAELNKFSVADLFNSEVGIAGVFANIKLADVLPSAFPAEDTDNKLMWAVGQTSVGGMLNSMSGSGNIMLQLKEDGAFAAVGGLEVTAVLGESQYINALLGSGAVFADLIADDGSIRMDEIIDGISIGELLGCQKNEIENTEAYVVIVGQNDDAGTQVKEKWENDAAVYVMRTDDGAWYEAEATCSDTQEDHVHTADCFDYVWYSTGVCNNSHTHANSNDMFKDGVYYPRVTGLYAVLSALNVTDLTSGNDNALMDTIKTLQVRDVVGENLAVSGVMNALMDLTIEELMSGAIDDLYLGEFFGFNRKAVNNVDDFDSDNMLTVYKKNDPFVITYYVMTDVNDNIAMSINLKDWFEGTLRCDEEHTHDSDCYLYDWYNNENKQVEGAQNILASKQISDLKHLNEEVQKLTLTDVFGKGAVPSMLASIADIKISDLNGAINTIHLGELLEYTRDLTCENDDENHEHAEECYVWYDKNGMPVDGMMAKLAGKQVSEMRDLTSTIKSFTLKDVLGNDIPDMLKTLADTEIGDLNTAIKTMHLGDFLEYEQRLVCDEEHDHTDECYAWFDKNGQQVNGMMSKLANKMVDDLGSLQETIQTFTLHDVLGEKTPKMLHDVADTPVGEMDSAIEKLYLGSAMGYYRKEIDAADYKSLIVQSAPYVRMKIENNTSYYIMSEDGNVWYEAVDENSDHDYKYVWYTNEHYSFKVSGVSKAFVNSKLNNVGETMNELTLKKLGISSDGNNILRSVENIPIMEISSHINSIKMGDVLGYTGVCNNEAEHEHNDDCDYTWYQEPDKTTVIKGLNAKIANMTVGGMNGGKGLTDIAKSLTIGDLIDSGMMSVGGTDNEYKLAIIYCGDNSHSSGVGKIGGGTYCCNLQDYLMYSVAYNGTTAERYWKMCHGVAENAELTQEQLEHRNKWMDMKLGDFINTLLGAIR